MSRVLLQTIYNIKFSKSKNYFFLIFCVLWIIYGFDKWHTWIDMWHHNHYKNQIQVLKILNFPEAVPTFIQPTSDKSAGYIM